MSDDTPALSLEDSLRFANCMHRALVMALADAGVLPLERMATVLDALSSLEPQPIRDAMRHVAQSYRVSAPASEGRPQ